MKSRLAQFCGAKFFCAVLAVTISATANAAVPAAEKLLPSDTLLVISSPDFPQLQNAFSNNPYGQMLNDPAMRPFRENFLKKWNEEFVAPLERDLGVKVADFSKLAQGQMTFAVTQNGWNGEVDPIPSVLFLLDTKDKAGQLKSTLSGLQKKWVDSGKPVKTETIRGEEFWVVPVSSNDIPRTIQRFFPRHQEIHELGEEQQKPAPPTQLFVGQHESLLISGTSAKAVESVLAHLTGGSSPALEDEAAFVANQNAYFRNTPLYVWFNAKRFFDVVLAIPPDKPNPDAPSPFPTLDLGKILRASGLGNIRTVAFAWRNQSDGSMYDLYIGAPESARTGLLKLMTSEQKDSNPPPFVPADVVKFQRWRLDGKKAVATIEKMAGEISPSALRVWNFIISTGNEAAKGGDDTGFDLRRDLIGNLGDDIITYSKPPRGTSESELNSPPSLLLMGSPNPDKMASAFKGALAIVSQSVEPKEREFLGKKIYTITMARLPMGLSRAAGKPLSYASSGGYVAFSTDVSTLEEYIRSNETPPKPLRELPGLADAAQKVGGQNTGQFTYENQLEQMRTSFALLKLNTKDNDEGSVNFNPLAGSIPFGRPETNITGFLDFSLLPPFEKVSKYFHFAVYSSAANSDGITYRYFAPTPPELKK